MSNLMLATELSPVVDGFQVLDFTNADTISATWTGTIPDAKHFIIQPIGGDLYWIADGSTEPTGVGTAITIADGVMEVFENQRAILALAVWQGPATVMVHLFE